VCTDKNIGSSPHSPLHLQRRHSDARQSYEQRLAAMRRSAQLKALGCALSTPTSKHSAISRPVTTKRVIYVR
jgi:hypothetical protein